MAWVKQGTVPMFPNVYDFGVGSAIATGDNRKGLWKIKNESTNRPIYVRFAIKKSGTSEFSFAYTPNSEYIAPGGELSVGAVNLNYTAYPTASDSFGVRADAYDDYPYITVYKDVNTAPTTPGPFTQPIGELETGDVKTFSWGASSDAEGGALTYELSQSINGGTFTVLGTTTSMSMNVSIPNATSLKIRVRAQDNQGAWSLYQQSDYTVTKPKYYWSKYNTTTGYGPWSAESTMTVSWAYRYATNITVYSGVTWDGTKYVGSNPVTTVFTEPHSMIGSLTAINNGTVTSAWLRINKYTMEQGNGSTKDYIYECTQYSRTRTTTNVRGTLVQSGIIAVEGTYPSDGRHSDGFWYVRGSRVNQSIAPTGAFTLPSSGTLFKPGDSATIRFDGSSAPNISLYEADYKYGNGAWQALSYSISTTRLLVITTDKTLGNVQFRVRTKNTSNVYSDYVYSEIYTIEHNSAPTINLTTPSNNQTLYENDSYIIDGTVLENNVGDTVTVRYQIGAETERAIKAYLSTGALENFGKQLTFRGGSLYDGETLIASNLVDGIAHTLKVWATDDKGGTSPIVERTFYVVPNRVPLLTVNTPIIEGNIDADLININGTFSDPDANNAVVSYRINGGNSIQIAEGVSGVFDFTVSFSQLIIGDNIIVIEVIDSYGAKTSKTIKLHKKAIETPLMESTQRYQLLPPSGSAVGVLFYIQRDAALDMDVSISMTQEAEAEQYTTLKAVTTAPISQGSGIVEDEYYHAAPEPSEKILLQIDFTRTSLTADEKIYVVMGAFE